MAVNETFFDSQDQYYVDAAVQAGKELSTCPRLAAGAVLVDDRGFILSSAGAISPTGTAKCTTIGCAIEHNHCIRTVHAEVKALLLAIQGGTDPSGCTLYVSHVSCPRCASIIAESGIDRVVFGGFYGSQTMMSFSVSILAAAGVEVLLPEGWIDALGAKIV